MGRREPLCDHCGSLWLVPGFSNYSPSSDPLDSSWITLLLLNGTFRLIIHYNSQ